MQFYFPLCQWSNAWPCQTSSSSEHEDQDPQPGLPHPWSPGFEGAPPHLHYEQHTAVSIHGNVSWPFFSPCFTQSTKDLSAFLWLFSQYMPPFSSAACSIWQISGRFSSELTVKSSLSLLVLQCSSPVAEHKAFNLSALIFVTCKMGKIIFSTCHERSQYLLLITRMYNPRYRIWAFILLPSKSMQSSHWLKETSM